MLEFQPVAATTYQRWQMGLVTAGQGEIQITSIRSELLNTWVSGHLQTSHKVDVFARMTMHGFPGGGKRETLFLWENTIFSMC